MSVNNFSTGLCDCFSDCGICIYAMCCPVCAMSDNWAQSRNEDCSICHFLAPVHPIWTRDNIRNKIGQHEKQYVNDFLVYHFCTLCAITQDARELKRFRSITLTQDPLIGQGNIDPTEPIVPSQNYFMPPTAPTFQQPAYPAQPNYPTTIPAFQDQGYPPQQPPQ